MKTVGIIPARMASSRFPGKPLAKILGRPMIEHVFKRAQMYPEWNGLFLATCDREIEAEGKKQGWPVIMTSDKHTRCLERVSEAAGKCGIDLAPNDVVVCVQGDEPMLEPNMIAAAITPLEKDASVNCTVLAMHIVDEELWRNPDTVKLVHNMKGDVLYTSRSPIPHTNKFTPELNARRIYGIFAFRWHFLKTFNTLEPSPLEIVESCDSNRIMDHGYLQRIAPYPARKSFSVDSPADLKLVEASLEKDPLWGKY
ncbi:MAG: 3-deoxy-manno-octulosonate cytidylyltransferase [Oligoflexia bacterium]|nr:3-deoxy-manno-octulosonate cytidylyltransferase [Oligoflexia bacterium]